MEAVIILLVGLIVWFIWNAQTTKSRPVNLAVLPERFIVFDFETTGLDSSKHEIIEIGAIRVNRDSKQHDTFEAMIKISNRIPKRITEITGISQEMVQDGIPLPEALEQFRAFVGDLPLVAFNAQFDEGFLRAACAKTDSGHFKNEVCCALQLARRAWPGRESYKLQDLARDGNLNLAEQHRALGDCQRAMIVYAAAANVVGTYR